MYVCNVDGHQNDHILWCPQYALAFRPRIEMQGFRHHTGRLMMDRDINPFISWSTSSSAVGASKESEWWVLVSPTVTHLMALWRIYPPIYQRSVRLCHFILGVKSRRLKKKRDERLSIMNTPSKFICNILWVHIYAVVITHLRFSNGRRNMHKPWVRSSFMTLHYCLSKWKP
jgi:hypothetical protein